MESTDFSFHQEIPGPNAGNNPVGYQNAFLGIDLFLNQNPAGRRKK